MGIFHRLKRLIKLPACGLGLNIAPKFGMIRQYANVIIEHFDKTAINREHSRRAPLICQNTSSQRTEQGSMTSENAHVAILAGQFSLGDLFIHEQALGRRDLEL